MSKPTDISAERRQPNAPSVPVSGRSTLPRSLTVRINKARLLGGVIGGVVALAVWPAPWYVRLFACGLVAPLGAWVGGWVCRSLWWPYVLGRGVRSTDRRLGDLPLGQEAPLAPATERRGQTFVPAALPARPPLAITLAPVVGWSLRKERSCHMGRVTALCFSPDGRTLLSCGKDGTVVLTDVDKMTSTPIHFFRGRALAVAVSIDGLLLAAAGIDQSRMNTDGATEGSVRVFDTTAFRELRRIELMSAPTAVAFLPDSRHLLIADESYLRIWELEGPGPAGLLDLDGRKNAFAFARTLALTPCGRQVLVAGQNSDTVRLFDLESETEVRRFSCRQRGMTLRSGAVTALDLHEDGQRLLTGGWDLFVRVVDMHLGVELRRFDKHRSWLPWRHITGAAWLPGDRAVSAASDGSVHVHDTLTGRLLISLRQSTGVTCLAVAPSGKLVALGCKDGVIRIEPID